MTESASTPPPSNAPTSRPWLWPAVVAAIAVAAVVIAVLVSGGGDSDSAPTTTTNTTTSSSAPETTATASGQPSNTPATTTGGDDDNATPACPEFTENLTLPLRLCDQGVAVQMMQENLTLTGFAVDADGFFGPATEAAVIGFQTAAGVEADGIYGPATSAAMDAALDTEGD